MYNFEKSKPSVKHTLLKRHADNLSKFVSLRYYTYSEALNERGFMHKCKKAKPKK